MQKDLFGNDIPLQPGKDAQEGLRKAEKQHRKLIGMYGNSPGRKCKDCNNLVKCSAGSKEFFKCAFVNPQLEGHVATDWRSGWEACGQFVPEEKSST
jgi:hypothetical protein